MAQLIYFYGGNLGMWEGAGGGETGVDHDGDYGSLIRGLCRVAVGGFLVPITRA